MNYLITGAGGREHALAWKLSQSPEVAHIYCMPGNAGTASTPKTSNVSTKNIAELVAWAQQHNIDRLLAGSEDLLVQGIIDTFEAAGIASFGPHQAAAMLEGSKSFAKKFMHRHGIKTAAYHVFEDYAQAHAHLAHAQFPLVIKADGLAAGKGVLICPTPEDAQDALTTIMKDKKFGSAGNTIVIEDYLEGFEVSIISLYDGKSITTMPSAKDHKKIFDNDQGKNTGGMGVVAPNPLFSKALEEDFFANILQPTLQGLEKDGLNFRGVIFFGLMVQHNQCYLLEYNLRFGDPEIQTLLTLMDSDLHHVLSRCMNGTLSNAQIVWKPAHACTVVLASHGYPDSYLTGHKISIPARLPVQVFAAAATINTHLDSNIGGNVATNHVHPHASKAPVSTATHTHTTDPTNSPTPNNWISNGGRVLNVVALGNSLAEAHSLAYNNIDKIHFEGMYYRKDIGTTD